MLVEVVGGERGGRQPNGAAFGFSEFGAIRFEEEGEGEPVGAFLLQESAD